jgi:hypothetical protein
MEVNYEPVAIGEEKCETCSFFQLKEASSGKGLCYGHEVNARGVCNMFKGK